MRRKDREITDKEKIISIIRRCHCCRLGLFDGEEVYIVPMNFGFEEEENAFYFHCAKEGRKIEILSKNPKVAFEMDTNYKLNGGELACDYSARFQSVMGKGTVSFVEEVQEKIKALDLIMYQETQKSGWTYGEAMLKEVCIFKLSIEDLSCKEHL